MREPPFDEEAHWQKHQQPTEAEARIAAERKAMPPQRRASAKRPGSGPIMVPFSRAEIHAIAKYAVPYPLVTASHEDRAAFESGMEKIKTKAVQRRQVKAGER